MGGVLVVWKRDIHLRRIVWDKNIAHLEEDGGCGHDWYTVEVVEDVLWHMKNAL